jgi:hypothetical protein
MASPTTEQTDPVVQQQQQLQPQDDVGSQPGTQTPHAFSLAVCEMTGQCHVARLLEMRCCSVLLGWRFAPATRGYGLDPAKWISA